MRGRCIVLSASSGGGKKTVRHELFRFDPTLVQVTSFTSRPITQTEVQGREYCFVSREEFIAMRDRGEFLEWAEFAGNLYGTPRDSVILHLKKGHTVLLEIEQQGARQVKSQLELFTRSIFLKVPLDILKSRLEMRRRDTPESIQKRLRAAEEEMKHIGEYDLVVDNSHSDPVCTAKEILEYINTVRGLASV